MKNIASHALNSIVVHALLGGFLFLALFLDTPQFLGSAGKSGSRQTRISLLVDTSSDFRPEPKSIHETIEKPVPKKIVKAVKAVTPPVAEGVIVPEKAPQEKKLELAKELPSDVKNPDTREIETPRESDQIETAQSSAASANSEPEASEGSSETAPAGALGQAGSGDEMAAAVGNSDRTNEMGVYLKILHARVQKNLVVPFDLSKKSVTQLEILLAPSGKPLEIRVQKSSGDRKLDMLAVNAARKALPVGALSSELRITIPVTFRIKTI